MRIEEFADALIISGDLDPVYIALCRVNLPHDQFRRWLFAYWCFYHMGVASYLSEFTDGRYWDQMSKAAKNASPPPVGERWPRGTERRHFRGEKCVLAMEMFATRPAETWVTSLYPFETADEIIKHVSSRWPQFGSWIGFKVADMLEVCAGQPIEFAPSIPLLYKEPAAALTMLAGPDPDRGTGAYGDLIARVGQYLEPAAGRRQCGVQEAETVLCKWKSHMNGHYPVGKDSREIRHHLSGWGDTAEALLRHAPAFREAA